MVEMIIVVAVLGIIVTITGVGWSSVTSSNRDQARAQDLKQWASTFDLYKSRYAIYPILPPNPGSGIPGRTFCLGTFNQDQPANYGRKCGQYKLTAISNRTFDANSTETRGMLAEVKKIGNVPLNSSYATRDAVVGPILYIEKNPGSGTSVNVTAKFVNFFEGSCPTGLQAETDPGIINIANGISNVSVCTLRKSFTYYP